LDRVHGELVNLQSTIAEARGAVASFKDRFVRFRSTSESTFERVWGMAVVTIGVVIALAIFEYKNLKGFLLKMKLVSKKRERERKAYFLIVSFGFLQTRLSDGDGRTEDKVTKKLSAVTWIIYLK